MNQKGLFKNPKCYYNVEREFIVAKKNEFKLNNHRFNDLQPNMPISSALMAYALHLFPPKFQTQFLEDKIFLDSLDTFEFKKKIIFVVLMQTDHFVLVIMDTVKNTFAVLDPCCGSAMMYFELFQRTHKNWSKVDYEIDNVETYNSGIYVLNYISQYATKCIVTKADSAATDLRLKLQKQIINQSDNMKALCLCCGTNDDGAWGQCTSCNRWFHCDCVKVDPNVIKNQRKYECFVCETLN